MDDEPTLLSNTFIGPVNAEPLDWRLFADAEDDDDEETATPPDVVRMLGFDPADEPRI